MPKRFQFRQKLKMFTRLFVLLSAATLLSAYRLHNISNVEDLKRMGIDGRIYGGVDTSIKTIPYQVSLQENGMHLCGGAILNPRIIVTAAHCVFDKHPTELHVRAGTSVNNKGGTLVRVSDMSVHDQYSDFKVVNDVAVLLLSSSLHQCSQMRSISLASSRPRDGAMAIVSGWGQTEKALYSTKLQSVHVGIVPRRECADAYGHGMIRAETICASAAGKDACQGDSGGPLVYNGQLIGIVSWGNGCAQPDYPGVYTNIPLLRKWILRAAKKLRNKVLH